MNRHLDFLWQNFDKIVLVLLIFTLILVHMHMETAAGNVIDPSEGAQINWLEGIIGQLLAALLTLLVTQKKDQGGKIETTQPISNTVTGANSVPGANR